MKPVVFLFLVIVSIACSNKMEHHFIPKEFTYSDEETGNGKTFTYKNLQTGEEQFIDIKITKKNGRVYSTEKTYTVNSVNESTLISNGQTLELYNAYASGDGTMIKGKKLGDTIIYGSERLGTHLMKWTFRASQLVSTMSIEEKFSTDTSINWQGRHLACLMITATGNVFYKSSQCGCAAPVSF